MNAHVYRHSLCPWIQLLRARKAALDECRYPRLCLSLLQQPDCACVLRVSHVTEVLGPQTTQRPERGKSNCS
jgi:hypothetical protein